MACPSSPSSFARATTRGASLLTPLTDIFVRLEYFRKSKTDNGDENLAFPEVGKT